MTEQLTFDLPAAPALGRSDFFVSPSNAVAVDTIQTSHDWPQGKLVLIGPTGAGKTHLAHVWAALTGARIVAAVDLADQKIGGLADGPVTVEDVDGIAGNRAAEEALFHLHNLVLANGAGLLITASQPPMRWGLGLPDLASRMQGSAIVTLDAPDDALLSAVLVKLFADRQVAIEPSLVSYLVSRMDRSFSGAAVVVDALDKAALSRKRPLSRVLAGEVLDKMASDEA